MQILFKKYPIEAPDAEAVMQAEFARQRANGVEVAPEKRVSISA